VLARRRPSGHIEQKVTLVIAGIDTHKDTLAVAVVDDAGRLIAGGDIPNTERGFVQLVNMFDTHHVLRVGIEGSGNFGRAVAVHLVLRWQPDWPVAVVEVPTLMTSRERRGQLGKGKTDPVDALAIARITAREQQLPPVRLTVGPAADLRALLDYREDLVRERGALVNRAHSELGGLRPGYQQQIPILTTRARVRAALELISDDTSVRATLCRRRLERVIAIDTETAELKRQIGGMVAAADTTLTDLYGVGPLIAARFIAEVVDIHRYPNRNAFAAANGTAPLPASSGRTIRHPVQPRREPAAQPVPLHDRAHPDSWRHRRPRLLRTQTRRRQDETRSPPLPEKATLRHRLRHHASRRCKCRRSGQPASPASLADLGQSGCGRRK
jgi:transposase